MNKYLTDYIQCFETTFKGVSPEEFSKLDNYHIQAKCGSVNEEFVQTIELLLNNISCFDRKKLTVSTKWQTIKHWGWWDQLSSLRE